MAKRPSPEYLRERLSLDEVTGFVTWKTRREASFKAKTQARRLGICLEWNARYAGKRAFNTVSKEGILSGRLDGASYHAGHIIWALAHGSWPLKLIGYKDGDRLNCAPSNLFQLTISDKIHASKPSNAIGVKGVRVRPGRRKPYLAAIVISGHEHSLGSFETAEAAGAAYRAAVPHKTAGAL